MHILRDTVKWITNTLIPQFQASSNFNSTISTHDKQSAKILIPVISLMLVRITCIL